MIKIFLYTYLILTASFVYAEEETSCEKKWNDHYDNIPNSELDPNDSLVKFMLIEDCQNDYKSMVERAKEMKDWEVYAGFSVKNTKKKTIN